MKIYELTPENQVRMKRNVLTALSLNYAGPIVIIAFSLFNGKKDLTVMCIYAAVILLIGIFWAYNTRKAKWHVYENKLTVDDEGITLQIYRRPDQHIAFERIKEIWQERRSLKIVDKQPGQSPILISDGFEGFNEIKNTFIEKGFTLKFF